MKKCLFSIAIIALAGISQSASADTIQGRVMSQSTGYGQGNNGGYRHKFWGGTGEAARYNTGTSEANATEVRGFCVDRNLLQEVVREYTLINVQNAPYLPNQGNAGDPYTAIGENRLNAMAKAGKDLGILDSRGFLDAAFTDANAGDNLTLNAVTTTRKKWVDAFQKLVWESLYEADGAGLAWNLTGGTHTNGASSAAAANALSSYASSFLNTNIIVRILGVQGNSANQGQDQLVLIPLPPAAWAGLSTMAGVFGLAYVRRRRQLA
jgi:hypothetical protein